MTIERIAIFRSEDGISWEKANKHFEDVLSHLLEGERVRCTKWREGVYLDVWKGYIMQNDDKNCWHWIPKVADLQEEWEIVGQWKS